MGRTKRKGGLSGVSKFVLESMKSTSSDTISAGNSSLTQTASRLSSNSKNLPTHTSRNDVDYSEELESEKIPPHVSSDDVEGSEERQSPGLYETRPAKKRKGNNGVSIINQTDHTDLTWIDKYDATGLVPHYTRQSQVPVHLQKCMSLLDYFLHSSHHSYSTQIFRSAVDTFLSIQHLLDVFLTKKGGIALLQSLLQIKLLKDVVAILFWMPFVESVEMRLRLPRPAIEVGHIVCSLSTNLFLYAVIALDTSATRLALARHNAQIYGVADRIEFILSDYISFAKSYLSLPSLSKPLSGNSHQARKIDVVFLSPPWGGPSYLAGSHDDNSAASQTTPGLPPTSGHPTYSISSISPIPGAQLFSLTRRITRNIAFYLPRNTRLEEVSALLSEENTGEVSTEQIEIEEEWMGTKLKALTCYFGGLVPGQEELF